MSAAVVYLSGVLEPFGWSYPALLAVWIPTTYIGCMITAFIITKITDLDLSKDPVYLERLKQGLVTPPKGAKNMTITKEGKLSVLIFVVGVIFIVLYATAISKIGGKPVLVEHVMVNRDSAIIGTMLTIATLISWFCKIQVSKITETSVFKSGMVASVCVIGVAWLGTVFVNGYTTQIKELSEQWVTAIPLCWL